MSSTVYPFPGVAPFIRRVADARGCVPPRMVHKATGMEHVARVQSALGQAVHAPHPKAAQEIVNNAIEWWESIEIARAGIEVAIIDVCRGLNLPDPPFAPEARPSNPEPKKEQCTTGTDAKRRTATRS